MSSANTPMREAADFLKRLAKDYDRDGGLPSSYCDKLNEIAERLAPSEIAPMWEPCSKDDPRFSRASFVIYDAKYIRTVRSNGDTYDHFIAPAPEFK